MSPIEKDNDLIHDAVHLPFSADFSICKPGKQEYALRYRF